MSSGASFGLIFVGLFLAGGVISFWKQGISKIAVGVLGACSLMALAAGVMRW